LRDVILEIGTQLEISTMQKPTLFMQAIHTHSTPDLRFELVFTQFKSLKARLIIPKHES